MNFGSIQVRWRRRHSIAALIVVVAAGCLPQYVSAYMVTGPSEAPTLLLGDRVIVNRAAYDLKLPYSTIRLAKVGEPRRGDLVLFLVPNRNTLGLKRVVGVPGDRVEMRENRLFINGHAAASRPLIRSEFDGIPPAHRIGSVVMLERFAVDEAHRVTFTPGRSLLGTFGPVEVPEECVFLLGDHRDNSNDSRVFGPIGRDLLGGKVVGTLGGSGR